MKKNLLALSAVLFLCAIFFVAAGVYLRFFKPALTDLPVQKFLPSFHVF